MGCTRPNEDRERRRERETKRERKREREGYLNASASSSNRQLLFFPVASAWEETRSVRGRVYLQEIGQRRSRVRAEKLKVVRSCVVRVENERKNSARGYEARLCGRESSRKENCTRKSVQLT